MLKLASGASDNRKSVAAGNHDDAPKLHLITTDGETSGSRNSRSTDRPPLWTLGRTPKAIFEIAATVVMPPTPVTFPNAPGPRDRPSTDTRPEHAAPRAEHTALASGDVRPNGCCCTPHHDAPCVRSLRLRDCRRFDLDQRWAYLPGGPGWSVLLPGHPVCFRTFRRDCGKPCRSANPSANCPTDHSHGSLKDGVGHVIWRLAPPLGRSWNHVDHVRKAPTSKRRKLTKPTTKKVAVNTVG